MLSTGPTSLSREPSSTAPHKKNLSTEGDAEDFVKQMQLTSIIVHRQAFSSYFAGTKRFPQN